MNCGVPGASPQQPGAASPPTQGSVLAALEWPGDVRELTRTGGAWPWLLVACALAIAAGTWFRRARGGAAVAMVAAAKPLPTAMARLVALALPAPGAPCLPFYRELKAVLRVHAAERFGLPGQVLTSEELQAALAPDSDLAAALSACDLVLFAAAIPGTADHDRAHAAACAWIAATSKEPA